MAIVRGGDVRRVLGAFIVIGAFVAGAKLTDGGHDAAIGMFCGMLFACGYLLFGYHE